MAALVVVRQAPVTARAILFMTLKDRHDLVEEVVYPDIWRKFRRIIHERCVQLVERRVQRDDVVMSVRAERFEEVPDWATLKKRISRDLSQSHRPPMISFISSPKRTT